MDGCQDNGLVSKLDVWEETRATSTSITLQVKHQWREFFTITSLIKYDSERKEQTSQLPLNDKVLRGTNKIGVEQELKILHLLHNENEKNCFWFLTYTLQYTEELCFQPRLTQLSCEDELRSRALSSSSRVCCSGTTPFWLSPSELVDGLAPLVIMFFNQEAWNLGDPPPLFELLGDSGPVLTLLVTPTRNLYATLLADTISVLACRNCNNKVLLSVQQ